ncbi:MAG: hypothetical protein WB683_14125, partial [Candidatus Sulfotelmatobacter sp.]
VKVDATLVAGSSAQADATAMLSALETSLLAGGVSQQTHDSIVAQIETPGKNGAHTMADNKAEPRKPAGAGRSPDVGVIAGLLLGSPEFQRR